MTQVTQLDTHAIRRAFVDSIHRTEQLFGHRHAIPLALQWLYRLLWKAEMPFAQNLKTTVVGDSIHVAWEAPEVVNPAWNRYFVRWFQVSTKRDQEKILSKSETRTVLEKVVTPGDQYEICVNMGAMNGKLLF